MAVPKKKTSKSKKNTRRAHDSISAPNTSTCPQCQEPKLPHRACANCGTYKGKEVVSSDEI